MMSCVDYDLLLFFFLNLMNFLLFFSLPYCSREEFPQCCIMFGRGSDRGHFVFFFFPSHEGNSVVHY